MDGDNIALLAAGALIVVGLTGAKIAQHAQLNKRPKQFAKVAKRLGLNFEPFKNFELAEEWRQLLPLTQYAFNVLRGERDGNRIIIFDFRRKNEDVADNLFPERDGTIFIMEMKDVSFHRLHISPVIARTIKFESAEFSRRYGVISDDKKFAYDICSPKMIEFLLQNPTANIVINGHALALIYGVPVDSDFIEIKLDMLVKIRSHMPDYLFTKERA